MSSFLTRLYHSTKSYGLNHKVTAMRYPILETTILSVYCYPKTAPHRAPLGPQNHRQIPILVLRRNYKTNQIYLQSYSSTAWLCKHYFPPSNGSDDGRYGRFLHLLRQHKLGMHILIRPVILKRPNQSWTVLEVAGVHATGPRTPRYSKRAPASIFATIHTTRRNPTRR